MLLVPVATPRVVEELPRDVNSSGGEEATVAALEKAVQEKYSKLRSWRKDSIPAGVKPIPRAGYGVQPAASPEVEEEEEEEGDEPQEESGVLHDGPSADYIDDIIDEDEEDSQEDLDDYA